MKMIVAVIQPFLLSKTVQALEEIEGFPGMTISEARGFGQGNSFQDGKPVPIHLDDFTAYFRRPRLEIVARDEMVDEIVNAVVEAARTGHRLDGMVFVLPVEQVVRIQTWKTNDAAL